MFLRWTMLMIIVWYISYDVTRSAGRVEHQVP